MIRFFKQPSRKSHFNSENISFKDNFIFVHIPKNAGTAISKSLGIDTSNHNTVEEYIAKLGHAQYGKMLSFAFVRNPFSRFVSLYNYARMEESFYHSANKPENALYGKHMDFDILKNASIEEAAYLLKSGNLKHNPPHIQWNPQCFWLKDKTNELNVKYLGRFEDIEFHLQNLKNLIGFSSAKKLEIINASGNTSSNYKKFINSETRAILEAYYKEDLDTFNYEF